MDETAHQILVSSTFTATLLEEPLRFWLSELKLPHSIAFPGYHQLFQTVLDPAGVFAGNRRGMNVALFRLEDLGKRDFLSEIEKSAAELAEVLASGAKRFEVPLLICLCPETPGFLETGERQAFASGMRYRLAEMVKGRPNLFVMDANRLVADYEVTKIDDPRAERAAHVPYTTEFFAALATGIVRMMLAIERRPVKAIAVDCDNTLWSGVCGEDGPAGVVIGEGRRGFQEFLLEQKRNGRVLALLSKNNESDVREVFALHAKMPLQWGDAAAVRINWSPKSGNLFELAGELELGVDSFVVLDDDARECSELRENSDATIFEMPVGDRDLKGFVKHLWPLDHSRSLTEEDTNRAMHYQEQAERKSFEVQANGLREFLEGLQLEIVFAPITAETLARVAQLTQRTNQMHTMLERYTEVQLERALQEEMTGFTASVSDRFGSYGLVGAVLAKEDGDTLLITDLLLSCRALGRGVEHKMVAHAAELAEGRRKTKVVLGVRLGPRNQPAVDFVRATFGRTAPPLDEATTWVEASVDRLKRLQLELGEDVQRPGVFAPKKKQVRGPANPIDYQRIATALNTARRIEAEMERHRQSNWKPERRITHPPSTELEQRLADLWSDLLGVSPIGIDEDFFDLGGHSLLAVQLLSRIQAELGVDIPDSAIYGEQLRIASLAQTIELLQLGIDDKDDYARVLAEIESMTDEEVDALLQKEELDLR